MSDPKQTEFERGALWAMKLLQTQLQDRHDRLRKLMYAPECDVDTSNVLNGVQNMCSGIKASFEIAMMKSIREAIKADQLTSVSMTVPKQDFAAVASKIFTAIQHLDEDNEDISLAEVDMRGAYGIIQKLMEEE